MLVLSFHGQSCFLHRRKGKAPLRKPASGVPGGWPAVSGRQLSASAPAVLLPVPVPVLVMVPVPVPVLVT